MRELEDCYRVLELEPGASMAEINQAYKDLVFIWHPDRIPKDNERLHQKAQEKLKAINYAREQLRQHQRENKRQDTSGRSQAKSQPKPTQARPSYRYRSYPRTYKTQPQPQAPFDTGWSYTHYAQQHPPRPTYTSADEMRADGMDRDERGRDRDQHTPAPAQNGQTDSAHVTTSNGKANRSGENFQGANLQERDLSGRDLSYANFQGADLSDAFLHRINLQGADLSGAKLFRANLLQANLREANLREANLLGADLSGADLRGADMTGAKVGFSGKIMVKLTGAILTGVTMPDGTVHD